MVLLALRRASLDWLLIDEFERLSRQVYKQQRADCVNAKSSSRKRGLIKEDQWSVQRCEEQDSIEIIPDASSAYAQLIDTIKTIRHLTNKELPEISSRIIHATSPILHELSRGFFVPVLTVALACLGRIHVLVLRLGQQLVGTLSEHVPRLREWVSEMRKRKEGGGGLIALDHAISPLFRVREGSSGGRLPKNNEWNDLMAQFIEISHEELTKRIDTFVKERRWKNAMTAFGIKKDDEFNEMLQVSLSNALCHDEDKKDVDSIKSDDMGELVYVKSADSADGDVKGNRSNVDVDDNLARVLDKRRIDEVATSAKKKRRRKKKKKDVDDLVILHDVYDTKNAEECIKTERKETDTWKKFAHGESLQNTAVSKTNSVFEKDGVKLDTNESECHESSMRKQKKKDKKKKSKKKKSTNVIDDIFG